MPKKFSTVSKSVQKVDDLSVKKQAKVGDFLEFTKQYDQELSIETSKHEVVRDLFETGERDEKAPKKFSTKSERVRKIDGLSVEKQAKVEAFLEFTQQYGQKLSIETSKHEVVKDIFETGRLDEKVLARHPTENMRTAISKFVSWFLDPYFEEFQEQWGWNLETLKLKLWPRREDGEVLIERLESIRPGLTQSQDPVTGEITQQPLYQAILNRIYNRASAEKGILRARKTGKDQGFYFPQGKS